MGQSQGLSGLGLPPPLPPTPQPPPKIVAARELAEIPSRRVPFEVLHYGNVGKSLIRSMEKGLAGWFTVVVPTLQRAGTLGRALDSILAQTYEKWITIVLDDGSTDATEALMRQYQDRDPRILYARYLQNRGGVAMNEIGMAMACEATEFWSRLGSDDWWGPQKLESDAKALTSGAEAVFAPYTVVRDGRPGETGNQNLTSEAAQQLLAGRFVCSWANVAVRTEVLEKIRARHGAFADPRLRNCEDFLVNARVARFAEWRWREASSPMEAVWTEARTGGASSPDHAHVLATDEALTRAIIAQENEGTPLSGSRPRAMRVIWIAMVTECERDIERSCARAGIDLEIWRIESSSSWDLCITPGMRKIEVHEIERQLERTEFDLVVVRYPGWMPLEMRRRLSSCYAGRFMCWQSEQGPTLEWALRASEGFSVVGVNNRMEMPRYKAKFRGAKILYMPAGCVASDHEVEPKEDLVVDGSAHFACTCSGAGNLKRMSVDTMVSPMIQDGRSLAIYGFNGKHHGWCDVPGAEPHYRGTYAPADAQRVYARHRVYLGITWNWKHGGFGIKLARAMASGIAVLWHRAPGMAEDGLIEGQHLLLSSSPAETREHVARLLGDEDYRMALGARGRAFALEHWEWSKTLRRVLREARDEMRDETRDETADEPVRASAP